MSALNDNEKDFGDIIITHEYKEFDSDVFNELEDEILSGFLVKKENEEIGIVRVEDDIEELGVGYILGLEVFDKGNGYGKKIMQKIFQLHSTQNSFVGLATDTSKPFWLKLGAEFNDEFNKNKFKLRNTNY